jgi:hypothetical protein
MSQKRPPVGSHMLANFVAPALRPRTFSDTDPQMLHALWMMEQGIDPDQTLQEVEQATVVYDKFAPRVSQRRS